MPVMQNSLKDQNWGYESDFSTDNLSEDDQDHSDCPHDIFLWPWVPSTMDSSDEEDGAHTYGFEISLEKEDSFQVLQDVNQAGAAEEEEQVLPVLSDDERQEEDGDDRYDQAENYELSEQEGLDNPQAGDEIEEELDGQNNLEDDLQVQQYDEELIENEIYSDNDQVETNER